MEQPAVLVIVICSWVVAFYYSDHNSPSVRGGGVVGTREERIVSFSPRSGRVPPGVFASAIFGPRGEANWGGGPFWLLVWADRPELVVRASAPGARRGYLKALRARDEYTWRRGGIAMPPSSNRDGLLAV